MNNSIATRVISIKGNKRRESFKERMHNKMNYSFFDAYIPSNVDSFETLFEKSDVFNYAKQYDPYAVIACAKSHFTLWNECVKSDSKMMILEDDVRFTDTEAEKALCDLIIFDKVKYDVFYLDGELGKEYNVRAPYKFHSCCAYIITPKIANDIIQYVLEHGFIKAVDWQLLEHQHKGFNYLTFERAALIPSGEKSNIKL